MFRLSANHWLRIVRIAQSALVVTYRALFAQPEFGALFGSRCLAVASVSMHSLALATTTYAATGSPLLTALAMFGGPLITLVGSATVLGASDRIRPRRATMIMPIAYGVAAGLQAIPNLPWPARFVILAMPFLAGSATSGSTMRLLHEIVPSQSFVLGRATLNIAVGVMQILGFALGGLALSVLHPTGVFLISAVLALGAVVVVRYGIEERAAVPSEQNVLRQTAAVNRRLLGSSVTRPIYLAMWVPNGLIVGCEALFVPFGGARLAGWLFAAGAAGMLLGDVVVGRFVPPPIQDRLIVPLRMLLALPFLGFVIAPPVPVLLGLAFVSAVGYSASLALQQRLVQTTDAASRGQVFGLSSTGVMVGQSAGAAVGGLVAEWLTASTAIGLLAAASIAISLALVAPLRRSTPARS